MLTAITSSCTYAAAVAQTNIPSDRSHIVQAEVKKYRFLAAGSDNEDVLQLREELQAKCKTGRIRGILTKDLRTYYLWIFFFARDTVATGYCVDADRTTARGGEVDG